MKTVKVIKKVLHNMKHVESGTLTVPDSTADHWIATGAAELCAEFCAPVASTTAPPVPPAEPKKGKGF